MSGDRKLLVEFQHSNCEAAFEALVQRYVNLVYSTALRQAGSHPHLVEDIVQKVFIDLALAARTFSIDVKIGGWLHRHTCYVAASTLRAERRRRIREDKATQMNLSENEQNSLWDKIEPVLDSSIDSLGERDRLAIVMRFFEMRDLRAIAEALGTSEDAAQKLVSRALEKLRLRLAGQVSSLSISALTAALAGQACAAAPSGMTAAVSAAAFSAASAGAPTSAPATIALFTMKVNTAYVATALAVCLGSSIVFHQVNLGRLKAQNAALHDQIAELELQAASSAAPARERAETPVQQKEFLELMRLRNEVTRLRQASNVLERLADENQRLRAAAMTEGQPHATGGLPIGQFIPREDWQFAGLAEPGAAFQSSLWAMSSGDLDTLGAAWTEDYLQQRLQGWAGQSEGEIKQGLALDTEKARGFTINQQEFVSNSEVLLELAITAPVEGEPPITRTARMKKVGSDWKFDGWLSKPKG